MMIWSEPDLLGHRNLIGLKRDDITVRLIDKTTAERVIKKLHYSGTVAWASSFHCGVFVDGKLIGALQFGPGLNPASGHRIVEGTKTNEWIELNRMAFEDSRPKNTGTRALSCALRLLRHYKPHVKFVQSFADERCRKLGAIYQAASFLYLGSHTGNFIEIDGKIFHQTMLAADNDPRQWRRGQKAAWVRANAARAIKRPFRQFRYVKLLDRRARPKLLMPVLPYPKPAQAPDGISNREEYHGQPRCDRP